MIKVAIVGATGYTGEELLKVLVDHPKVEIVSLSAKIDKPEKISHIFPYLESKIDLVCKLPDFAQIISKCDLAFLALPHCVSMEVAPLFLQAQKRVIDLSADYRLQDIAVYEKWYGRKHQSPEYIKEAVYGLAELHSQEIKQARLVANPGCYPTGIILGVLPALKRGVVEEENIIVDAKSGLSGAGREREPLLLAQMQDNFCAYKVDAHQHAPEIDEQLSRWAKEKIKIIFTPYLIPIKRGILSTIYLSLKKNLGEQEVQGMYQDFYRQQPFVQILPKGEFPQLKDVAETNSCRIGWKLNSSKRMLIVICAIDNLVKGASGQAVQNMNIMYGFSQTEGLK